MVSYWPEVDDNGGRQEHELYLPDVLYAVRSNRFEGRENVQAFYDRRRQLAGTITSSGR
jgi:hypothetical protein